MNFFIAGKKMMTTSYYHSNPKKEQPIAPIMIQSKPITHKINEQPKKKLSFHITHKTPNKKRRQSSKVQVKKQPVKKFQATIGKTKVQAQQEQLMANKSQAVTEAESKTEDTVSQVIIRYNHYKHPFVSINGVLSFQPIQEKYSFSDAFHGNFLPILKIFKTNEQIMPLSKGKAVEYRWPVEQNVQYRLQIEEDEQQESKHQKKIYKSPQTQCCPFKQKKIVQQLTQELKKLSPSEYGGEKHRQILEQRDLQELLYS